MAVPEIFLVSIAVGEGPNTRRSYSSGAHRARANDARMAT